ncbi:MAG: amidohydrolase family protein [Bacteroidota bacterium]
MRKLLTSMVLVWVFSMPLLAQETTTPNDVKDKRDKAYAFTNATIVVNPTTTIENGTLIVKGGKIIQVGANVRVPAGYAQVDLAGKYIYPSLIDVHTHYGMPKVDRVQRRWGQPEQIQSKTEGPYNANEAIKSEFESSGAFTINAKEAKAWRNMGFGTVLTFRPDGIARGTSALVTLGEDSEGEVMLKATAGAHYSFDKGSSTQDYPSSSMGYISLLRQTYMDADWYGGHKEKPFTDKSLDAWLSIQDLPQFFEVNNWQSVIRADKVGDEFGVQYIIKGSGDIYKRMDAIKATAASMIIPLNFPKAYDVDDPFDAYEISLADMKHWELAPSNPAAMEKVGIRFALTADDLKDKKAFWANLKKAIKHGLSKETALAALTTIPASMAGAEDMVGSLEKGKLANFIICSGDLFEGKTKIYENWVQGTLFKVAEMDMIDFAGKYELKVDGQTYELTISGDAGSHKGSVKLDTTELKTNMSVKGQSVSLSFTDKDKKLVNLSGWQSGKDIKGSGQLSSGAWTSWTATFQEESETDKKKENKKDAPEEKLGEVIYPFVSYGTTELPQQQDMLIKNATVWTMEDEGILENTDVKVENGKIVAIGKNLNAGGATVVDGTGKHLTPGIVDEHSHIAATSINDVATNSAMVRMEDVLDSEHEGIYRALAGGVTSIQVLHGSANPIGGQSALIKLRWGEDPEGLKISNAPGFIKFALGENVKRSRSSASIRYPQTRMGVEQVFVDAFTAAKDYEKAWNTYNALSDREKAFTSAPRRDLAMDATAEIVNSERFISCHSYVQSEVNMLMKVADQFDFTVNTFTHILEGYKVADKMAEHGAGGASFSDWWGFKWEVRYAIPYNPSIMVREGVLTAINSDDPEMMRRLNQEAAKSVKYGDLDEIECMKMVTINPAKLLHLDDRLGSIKKGKDADLVLWTNHPLSIYAQVEKTIVDGTVYFDLFDDQERKKEVQAERARLIAKMKEAKKSGQGTQKYGRGKRHHFECETEFIYGEY